ncbi:MAG: hypothetical protein IPM29_09445 [Planctomycetes bacterium]|nr:hypothetical protein [Planctomycetota bacterium]
MKAILSGLFVTIVGGVIVWYLTSRPPTPKPPGPVAPARPANLEVEGRLAHPYRQNQLNQYRFRIYNSGGSPSEPCILQVGLQKSGTSTYSFFGDVSLMNVSGAWYRVPAVAPGASLEATGTTGGLEPGLWIIDSRLYSAPPNQSGSRELARHTGYVESR